MLQSVSHRHPIPVLQSVSHVNMTLQSHSHKQEHKSVHGKWNLWHLQWPPIQPPTLLHLQLTSSCMSLHVSGAFVHKTFQVPFELTHPKPTGLGTFCNTLRPFTQIRAWYRARFACSNNAACVGGNFSKSNLRFFDAIRERASLTPEQFCKCLS